MAQHSCRPFTKERPSKSVEEAIKDTWWLQASQLISQRKCEQKGDIWSTGWVWVQMLYADQKAEGLKWRCAQWGFSPPKKGRLWGKSSCGHEKSKVRAEELALQTERNTRTKNISQLKRGLHPCKPRSWTSSPFAMTPGMDAPSAEHHPLVTAMGISLVFPTPLRTLWLWAHSLLLL